MTQSYPRCFLPEIFIITNNKYTVCTKPQTYTDICLYITFYYFVVLTYKSNNIKKICDNSEYMISGLFSLYNPAKDRPLGCALHGLFYLKHG
jgi:hypothetical protein